MKTLNELVGARDIAILNGDIWECTGDELMMLRVSGRVDFRNVHIKEQQITANLVDTIWHGARLDKVTFIDCDMTRAEFHGATVQYSDFLNCILSDSRFLGSEIMRTNFWTCDMAEIKVAESRWIGGKCRSKLKDCSVRKSAISEVDFASSDFSRGMFFSNQITLCEFTGAVFVAARFDGGVLRTCEFIGADFRSARLVTGVEFCEYLYVFCTPKSNLLAVQSPIGEVDIFVDDLSLKIPALEDHAGGFYKMFIPALNEIADLPINPF